MRINNESKLIGYHHGLSKKTIGKLYKRMFASKKADESKIMNTLGSRMMKNYYDRLTFLCNLFKKLELNENKAKGRKNCKVIINKKNRPNVCVNRYESK